MSILFQWPSNAYAEREFLECVSRAHDSGCRCYRNACSTCRPVLNLAEHLVQQRTSDYGQTIAQWSVWRAAGRDRIQAALGENR